MTPLSTKEVPVEPTDEMIKAAHEWNTGTWPPYYIYRAMIAAAPQQQGEPVYQVLQMVDGKFFRWFDVDKEGYDAMTLDCRKRIVSTSQTPSADAMFNAGVESVRSITETLLNEVQRAEGDYGIGLAMTKAEEALEQLKRPTDMVLMSKDDVAGLHEVSMALEMIAGGKVYRADESHPQAFRKATISDAVSMAQNASGRLNPILNKVTNLLVQGNRLPRKGG
jgi:hypothetical protein